MFSLLFAKYMCSSWFKNDELHMQTTTSFTKQNVYLSYNASIFYAFILELCTAEARNHSQWLPRASETHCFVGLKTKDLFNAFWKIPRRPWATCIFYVRVFNPFAKSHLNQKLDTAFTSNENEKNWRHYSQRVIEVKHGSFRPLVFSPHGWSSRKALKIWGKKQLK